MIDSSVLRKQRVELHRMRLKTLRIRQEYKLQEATNRLRAAELEAVSLGIRIECPGCHSEVSKSHAKLRNATGLCHRCNRTQWEARKRSRSGPLTSAERAA